MLRFKRSVSFTSIVQQRSDFIYNIDSNGKRRCNQLPETGENFIPHQSFSLHGK